jgi:hypothetical protein
VDPDPTICCAPNASTWPHAADAATALSTSSIDVAIDEDAGVAPAPTCGCYDTTQ